MKSGLCSVLCGKYGSARCQSLRLAIVLTSMEKERHIRAKGRVVLKVSQLSVSFWQGMQGSARKGYDREPADEERLMSPGCKGVRIHLCDDQVVQG